MPTMQFFNDTRGRRNQPTLVQAALSELRQVSRGAAANQGKRPRRYQNTKHKLDYLLLLILLNLMAKITYTFENMQAKTFLLVYRILILLEFWPPKMSLPLE